MIGDDGERLDRRARQLARFGDFLGQQPGQIVGGAEGPFAPDLHQIDAARRILGLQPRQRVLDVDAVRQRAQHGGLVERLAGGKQQSLEQAQFVGARHGLAHAFLGHFDELDGLDHFDCLFERCRRVVIVHDHELLGRG